MIKIDIDVHVRDKGVLINYHCFRLSPLGVIRINTDDPPVRKNICPILLGNNYVFKFPRIGKNFKVLEINISSESCVENRFSAQNIPNDIRGGITLEADDSEKFNAIGGRPLTFVCDAPTEARLYGWREFKAVIASGVKEKTTKGEDESQDIHGNRT